MTYVALDKYVKGNGRLGFLITQTVFKTVGSEGFRRFRLQDGTLLGVVHVDDMVDLKPFEGASNRTTIFVMERGRATKYPIPYTYWRKKGGGATIPEALTVEEVQAITVRSNFVAQPVDAVNRISPWISGREWALEAVKKVLGASDYQARAGVCTWLNGVYWVEIVGERPDGLVVIDNFTKGGKRKVENVQTVIEPDLLHPMLRGRDVKRWQALPALRIIVPHTPETSWRAIPEEEMRLEYPKTYAYLQHFSEMLLSHRFPYSLPGGPELASIL